MSESADDLIARCRTGDGAAREALFSRYQHYLLVLARAQLGRHLQAKCDASDVVQMTMLEAHRDFGAFQGTHEAELLAWMRRILSHNLFNEARRYNALARDAGREVSMDAVRAGVEQSSMALHQGIAAVGPSPGSVAQRREDAVLVADALCRLPDDYRTVLLLRVFEGLSAEEVAEKMGRTAGAVRMLQLRALEALRSEMTP